jgi:outer membrane protein OmpA-like peptidoglycan-associated protein/ABC-type nitrate/sulfonate/bicarbonate transport system substrate-binding protein
MPRLKPQAKFVLILIVGVGVVFGLRAAMQHGLIPTPGIMKSIVASRVTLPPQEEAQVANVQALPYPSTVPANVGATHITFDVWEWNAMFALIYANGGPDTTKGSLMEKNGVNLTLHREDSNTQMSADLVACAKQLHDGEKTCSSGAEAIVVMGDSGGSTWLSSLNPTLKKLGPDYQAVIIGAVGRSNGEDALLGPAEWKSNPQSMKGKTVVGVIRDGDWNIALNYMGSNGLKNNPDLKTYDPDAVNWISAPDEDYTKAVTEVFVPNRCEDRKVVKDGRATGETKNVCPDGVVTWTPGDELAVHGRPGTTKIISSHEYASQMPAVILGIKKFFNDNRDEVTGILAASFQAADQVKAFDAVRRKAGEISTKLYNDSATDWYKYYPGFRDPQSGQMLGGSAVFGLEDNVNYFGLDGKHNNNMRATYETFGKIATENYPVYYKDNPVPPYKEAVDTSFIFSAQALLNTGGVQGAAAETVDYAKETQSGTVLGHKAVYINFASGSDQPLPDSIPTLNELKDSLAINSQLALQIDGYTDNAGSDAVNVPLSGKRAQAVKSYFQKVAPLSFPDSRFKSVAGHGSESPIASNASVGGKALNRRVEITQIGQ